MSDPWHGTNDPGYWIKPQAAPADNTRVAVTDNDTKPKEKASPVATLSDAKFLPPQSGIKFNDKCPVKVSVTYKEKTSQTRVTFKLFCNYKNKKEDLKSKVDANESNGFAKAEFQLFYPEDFSDGSVEYFFTAEHCRGDKVVESEKLTLPHAEDKNICFPLDFQFQDKGYQQGARSFGSSRNNGDRTHAGCDLYAPAGENIYAVADGEVKAYHDFYMQTYAMVIDHKDFMVRYGEIQPPKDHDYGENPSNDLRNGMADKISIGAKVKKGQHIAFVGQLRQKNTKTDAFENYKQTMLHFEMFKGTAGGDPKLLTVRNNLEYDFVPPQKYERRKDLLNPTEYLDKSSSI